MAVEQCYSHMLEHTLSITFRPGYMNAVYNLLQHGIWLLLLHLIVIIDRIHAIRMALQMYIIHLLSAEWSEIVHLASVDMYKNRLRNIYYD